MAGRGRSNADALLVVALAQGKTVAEAAKAAGVAERTVYRRLEDAEFQFQVDEARQVIVDRALGVLAEGMVDAAHAVKKVVTEGTPALQLQASFALMDRYARLLEQHRERAKDLRRQGAEVRREREAFTMDKALAMLAEAGSDKEQRLRVWRVIETTMESSIRWKFDGRIEAEDAQVEWELHRPASRRGRPLG